MREESRLPEGRTILFGAFVATATFGTATEASLIQSMIHPPILGPILVTFLFPAAIAVVVVRAGMHTGWVAARPGPVAYGAFLGTLFGLHSTAAGFGWVAYWAMSAIGAYAGFVFGRTSRPGRLLLADALAYLAVLNLVAVPAVLVVPQTDFYGSVVLVYAVVVGGVSWRMVPRKAFGGAAPSTRPLR